jgi:hypothetical protein
MGNVEPQFYNEMLRHINAPIDEVNVKACIAWQAAEGGTASWNPFNTTQPAAGSTLYNSAGVRNYPSEVTGINATVETLLNGRYTTIIEAFRRGSSGLAVCEAVDGSAWGTHGAAAVYRSRFPDAP